MPQNQFENYINDRSPRDCMTFLGLSIDEITSLPDNALVVEAGSGIKLRLLRAIHKLNPSLKLLAVDPTLGLKLEDCDQNINPLPKFNNIKALDYNGNSITVYDKRFNQYYVNPTELQAAREEFIRKTTSGIDLYSNYLPNGEFKSKYRGRVSLYLDLFSTYFYYERSSIDLDISYITYNYLRFIYKLLDLGGKAIISPGERIGTILSKSFSQEFGKYDSDLSIVEEEITKKLWELKIPMVCTLGRYKDYSMGDSVWIRLKKVDPWIE